VKEKKSEEEERVEYLEEVIERTFNHPDVSPWHVREALRLVLEEIKILRKEIFRE
jgi:hypothetical protein